MLTYRFVELPDPMEDNLSETQGTLLFAFLITLQISSTLQENIPICLIYVFIFFHSIILLLLLKIIISFVLIIYSVYHIFSLHD